MLTALRLIETAGNHVHSTISRPLFAFIALLSATTLRTCLLLACGSALAASAGGQQVAGEWGRGYTIPGLGVRVYAVTTWQGKLVAGGYFMRSGGTHIGSVAVYDGVSWQPLGETPDGTVRAFAELNGELYATGTFDTVGNQQLNHVARWDGTAWRPLGTGLTGIGVNPPIIGDALCEYNGELWVGGMLSAAGGVPCDNLARWDGTQWHAIPGGAQGLGSPAVRTFLSEGNELHVAGEFTSIGGVAANNIARFDGTNWSALGSGTNSYVSALARYQGDLYAGGFFIQAGGQTARKIARWNGTSWSALAGGIPDFAISPSVSSLAVHDGELMVGGNFQRVDTLFTRRLARWNGSAWAAADGLVGTDLATTAIAMTEWNDKLIIGGDFIDIGAPPDPGIGIASSMIAAWDDGQWFALGGGMGVDAELRTLSRWNDRWIVGGRFLNAGHAFAQRIAAFDGAAYSPIGSVQNGDVWDSIEFNGDLVITGSFSLVEGQTMLHTARFDGTQWHSMGSIEGYTLAVHQGELYIGGLGGVRRWTGSSWANVGSIGGIVSALYSHGGLLWIGGNFSASGGALQNLAVWNGTNLIAVPGGAPNGTVDALGIFQNEIVVGGEFTSIGSTGASHVARFDGASWHALGAGIGGPTSFTVLSFLEHQNRLYVGGSFTRQGGSPGDNVARWDGTQWQALRGGGLDGWVTDMEVVPGSNSILLVGGFLGMEQPALAGIDYSIHIALWSEDGGPQGIPFCTGGFGLACPCGNDPIEASGCVNATGVGAMLSASGSTSASADDLVLRTTGLPAGTFAMAFASQHTTFTPIEMSGGLRCLDGPIVRLRPIAQASAGGTVVRGNIASLISQFAPSTILPGSTWHIQDWYRSPGGPCSGSLNLSNGLSFTFTP
jgi:hypothetical protein